MPILQQPEVKEKTLENKQKRVANKIKRSATILMRMIVKRHGDILKDVWQNEDDLTPQQVFDALGENAVEAVTLSRDLVDFVNAKVADTIDTSGLPTLTLNVDGTVTVT